MFEEQSVMHLITIWMSNLQVNWLVSSLADKILPNTNQVFFLLLMQILAVSIKHKYMNNFA